MGQGNPGRSSSPFTVVNTDCPSRRGRAPWSAGRLIRRAWGHGLQDLWRVDCGQKIFAGRFRGTPWPEGHPSDPRGSPRYSLPDELMTPTARVPSHRTRSTSTPPLSQDSGARERHHRGRRCEHFGDHFVATWQGKYNISDHGQFTIYLKTNGTRNNHGRATMSSLQDFRCTKSRTELEKGIEYDNSMSISCSRDPRNASSIEVNYPDGIYVRERAMVPHLRTCLCTVKCCLRLGALSALRAQAEGRVPRTVYQSQGSTSRTKRC